MMAKLASAVSTSRASRSANGRRGMTLKKNMALKKKKRTVRRRTWNKGLEVGQKDAFTPAQVRQIRRVLTNRGAAGARDLSLFSLAIDTMLQGPELLNLTVKDVAHADGRIRSIMETARSRRKRPVRCALSKGRQQRLQNGSQPPA